MQSIRSPFWRALLDATTDWSARRKPPADVEVQALAHFGLEGEWLIPAGASSTHCILYIHGGAYSHATHESRRLMLARVAKAANTRAFLLDYRGAPEHLFATSLEDGLTAFRWLVRQGFHPGRIVLAGDSAGGGLALALATQLRNTGSALPGLMFLISPWANLRDARIAPHFADLSGLPPMLVHAGTDEMLLAGSRALAEKAEAAGVKVELRAPTAAIADIGAYVRTWKASPGRKFQSVGKKWAPPRQHGVHSSQEFA